MQSGNDERGAIIKHGRYGVRGGKGRRTVSFRKGSQRELRIIGRENRISHGLGGPEIPKCAAYGTAKEEAQTKKDPAQPGDPEAAQR